MHPLLTFYVDAGQCTQVLLLSQHAPAPTEQIISLALLATFNVFFLSLFFSNSDAVWLDIDIILVCSLIDKLFLFKKIK